MDGILFYNDVNFDTFHIAESNCKAAWEAKQFAMNPYEHGTFYLYGKKGNGRTHLATSIEMEWAEKGIRVRELIGQILLFELQLDEIYRAGFSKERFCEDYENAEALCIEDLEIFEGKKEQEYIGELVKSFLVKGKPVLLTGEKSPEEYEGWNEWILKCVNGHSTEIKDPELELRMSVLKKYMERWHYEFPDEVVRRVAEKAKTVEDVIIYWRGAINHSAFSRGPLTEEVLMEATKMSMFPEEEMMELRMGLQDMLMDWIEELDKEAEKDEKNFTNFSWD